VTRLLDTHCHLGDYDDPRRILAAAAEAAVDVIAVTDNPDAYRRLRTRLGPAPGVTVALDDLFQGIICGDDARVPKIRL
jgi:TatD DNase family protein